MKDENRVEKWLTTVGWKENPFTLKIKPSLFVGYSKQIEDLERHIIEGHKMALVTGSTGSGKTTTLRLIEDKFSPKSEIIYLAKPPKMTEIVEIFTDVFKLSLFERFKNVNVHIHSLASYVNRKCKKNLVLMIDEIHESDVEVLEWIRTLGDQIDNMQIILSGLPNTDDFLRRNLETLRNRITTHITLTSLSESETTEFIRRRIESAGGEGMLPFDDKLVRQIYQRSGGFPREIIKACNEIVEKAIEGEKLELDKGEQRQEPIKELESESSTEVVQVTEVKSVSSENKVNKDFIRDIPSKQRRILKILAQNENMYPSEIAKEIGVDKYQSKQHAVRSMNNILNRLMNDGYVDRSARGKGYVYFLVPKVRSILTEA